MTSVLKLTGLFLIVVFLAACNSGEKTAVGKHVFLLDDFNKAGMLVEAVTEQSGVNKKGYVVIVAGKSGRAVEQAKRMKQEFYKKGIMAVHVLNVDANTNLLRTDVITIENAKIISLPGSCKVDLSGNNQFGLSLFNAFKNNAFIIAGNKETEQVFANADKP
jgi:hypothetical protein